MTPTTPKRYHCVDCYFRALFEAFASGDPDSFEDGEIEETEEERP